MHISRPWVIFFLDMKKPEGEYLDTKPMMTLCNIKKWCYYRWMNWYSHNLSLRCDSLTMGCGKKWFRHQAGVFFFVIISRGVKKSFRILILNKYFPNDVIFIGLGWPSDEFLKKLILIFIYWFLIFKISGNLRKCKKISSD